MLFKNTVTSGNVGNPGQNGTEDSSSLATALGVTGSSPVGLAGYYIDENSFVNCVKSGDVLGNIK